MATAGSSYRVDTSGKPLPNVTYAHILDGILPGDVVRDRVVLVGPNLPPVLQAHDRIRVPGGGASGKTHRRQGPSPGTTGKINPPVPMRGYQGLWNIEWNLRRLQNEPEKHHPQSP